MIRFRRALLQAFLHSIVTLAATLAIWAVWIVWVVTDNGNSYTLWAGLGDDFRFGMYIALVVGAILCGGFLVMSFIFHLRRMKISKRGYILSTLTLALGSLSLWLALPDGGAPLVGMFVGIPIVASLWMQV